MKKLLSAGALAALALALSGSASAQDLTPVVTQAQFLSGTGAATIGLRFLSATTTGSLIACNHTTLTDSNHRIMAIDISGASPAFTTLAVSADYLTAITNAGGTAPASMTARGMGVAANGNVIVGTDDTGIGSYLFRITAPHQVQLLSGLQVTPTVNPVDGLSRLTCVGNTAVLLIQNEFNAQTGASDHLQSFDVTSAATGTQSGTLMASEASIFAAIGGSATEANVGLNAPVAVSATKLLFANSSAAADTDELLTADTSSNVTLAKSKASLVANLSPDTDVGFGAAAYHSGTNTIYLNNVFGGAAFDDDIIKVTNGGTGTASAFVSDSTLEADSDYPTGQQLAISADGMVIMGNFLYINDSSTVQQIYKIALSGAGVNDWSVY